MAVIMIKDIAVIGVGGVGGFFGGKLCQLQERSAGIRVSFVARGPHLKAIQTSGLLLCAEQEEERVCRPFLATDDFSLLPPPDLCLLCVKEFDLANALAKLRPLLGERTLVLPLLNGVDVQARVRSLTRQGIVFPACVYVGTHIERPGKVIQKGGACRILLGPDPAYPGFDPIELTELFDAARIKSEWTLGIESEIWKKFIFICSFGLVSAAHHKTLGEILSEDEPRGHVQAVIAEVVALARAAGVSLPEDIAESSLRKAGSFPPEAKTSLQRDFERADRRDERDLFAGSTLRIARQLGLDAPVTRKLAAMLEAAKPWPN